MQLASKMRFISAQIDALLSDELWLRNAQHSNRMAKLAGAGIEEKSRGQDCLSKWRPTAFSPLFPGRNRAKLKKRYFFYVWDEAQSMVRWMCSFDTTEEDIIEFVKWVAQAVSGNRRR